MKIYTIVRWMDTCTGHGESDSFPVLNTIGFYGADGFSPCFRSRLHAEIYISDNELTQCKVVELDCHD